MKDLSLHILDILQNSVTAEAGCIRITLRTDKESGFLTVKVEDDGKGMERDFLQRVTDPFATSRTTRKVGLGLPLFKASAEAAGGHLEIASEKGKGTRVTADFMISHIDRLPLGDMGETITGAVLSGPGVRVYLVLENGTEQFVFDTLEIEEKLGGVPLTTFDVLEWIREYVNGGIESIFGGVLDEIVGGTGSNQEEDAR